MTEVNENLDPTNGSDTFRKGAPARRHAPWIAASFNLGM
jgi:hypothetical protein